MEKKINISEILKDCPTGMELDCVMYDDCELLDVDTKLIRIKTPCGIKYLDKYGCYTTDPKAKCVIFPKGKTTWEGFVPPCQFKDGDIVSTEYGDWIGITTGGKINSFIPTYCVIMPNDEFEAYLDKKEKWQFHRLATEEEKQKLFDAIKNNGYKWNAETKTLEKLIEPKFKVGNKIEKCGYRFTIAEVKDGYYLTKCGNKIPIDNQDDFSLVPNKFDITTLKPFDSRVLVRDYNDHLWMPTFWGKYLEDSNCRYLTTKGCYKYCIPYEGNEHLLGTTDDCEDFYKTWRNDYG